ncbi:hypothetical protein TNCV_3494141 [Trichonephila clavipes]|nr:hypothetical protein TNCV_3494141 [Trichonephila clavipes]
MERELLCSWKFLSTVSLAEAGRSTFRDQGVSNKSMPTTKLFADFLLIRGDAKFRYPENFKLRWITGNEYEKEQKKNVNDLSRENFAPILFLSTNIASTEVSADECGVMSQSPLIRVLVSLKFCRVEGLMM